MKRHRNSIGALAAISVAIVFAAAWKWVGPSQSDPTIEATHIVLISIDTCRADHLGCYGFSTSYTPHLDALAQEGVLFENVVSPVPLTLPSHSTMLTGTIPPFHGVRDNTNYYLDDVYITLPEILRDHNYTTGAVISAFVLDSRFGLDQGFDKYDDDFDDPADLAGMLERRGAEVTDHAVKWLEQHHDEKGFLFLHYFDPHMNYDPPAPWGPRFVDRPYLGEIAYTDDCIGQVVQKLKELGIYESTLLIVTSDHGEMLGDHGEVTHSYFIYQGVVRVPLIVKLPGPAREPRRVASFVGVVDIAPTICGLLGIEMPAPVQGADLSPLLWGRSPADRQRPQYCESITPTKYNGNPLFGVVMAGWKYIDTTRPELYDIRADPGETNNLVDADPDRAVAMRVRLDEMLAVDSPRKESGRAVWDEQAARQMRSLGYVGGAVRDQELSVDPMRADPKDLIALHNPMSQVQGLIKHKQYTQAREICIKIVSQHPEVAEAHFLLAKIAMGERKYAEAAEHFSQYVAINPDDPMAHNRLGLACWETGQQDRAIASVRRALKINPTFPEAYGNLGRFLLLQGDVDQGIHNLQKAVELKPDFGVAHLALARALWKQKKADDAAYHLQQVIQTGPDRAEAYFALAGIRRSQRRLDDAADHYRQAIAKRPKFLAAHQHLGNVLQSQRKLTEALEHYRRALELAPNSIDLLNNVAWILATHPDPHLRQTEEALRIARRAADEKGGADPSVLDTLAAAYANANQFDEAVATATEALKLLDATNHEAFRKQVRQRLQLYQQGLPHREPIAEQEHRR